MTVAVVGAGLAGLACAVELERSGIDTAVYEASDGVGGRVRSDRVDGFIIDRGFQVALLAYPELHRGFDLAALDFQPFDPGALVWRDGRGAVVADPFRQPRTVVSTATAPIGSLFDKARIAQLRDCSPARTARRAMRSLRPDSATRSSIASSLPSWAGFNSTRNSATADACSM